MSTIHTVTLTGCSPVPLAHYLKALGILRLVAEQADTHATGRWIKDRFELHSTLDETSLLDFFLNRYAPTPVLSPWNAGSGFYYQEEKVSQIDQTTGKKIRGEKIKTGVRNQETAATKVIAKILDSDLERLSVIRETIRITKDLLDEKGYVEAPDGRDKDELLMHLRSIWPDAAVQWLDCVAVLTASADAKSPTGLKPSYTTLLGSGANDGNADFSSNFMQRISEVFGDSQSETTKRRLRASLFGGIESDTCIKKLAGQYFPGSAGGVNTTSGFESDYAVNPWDFILLIEGSLMFAAAAVRAHQSLEKGAIAYPFCVSASGVGYASAALQDELADKSNTEEMWMPLWQNFCSTSELLAVFAEGRAQVAGRAAKTGVDFVRSIVGLGVDRGISAFQRFGFLVRNGKSVFATPLDRMVVPQNSGNQKTELLCQIDRWLTQLRHRAGSNTKGTPLSVQRALLNLEKQIILLCKHSSHDRLRDVLIALGKCERALAVSSKWARGLDLKPPMIRIHPVSGLSTDWLYQAYDGSPEFRLAASVASLSGTYGDLALPLRCHLEAVEIDERGLLSWAGHPTNDVQSSHGSACDILNAVFARRLLRAVQSGESSVYGDPEYSNQPCFAEVGDIKRFIEGKTDDTVLIDLLWGLSLIKWSRTKSFHSPWGSDSSTYPVLFALFKLCFLPAERGKAGVPLVPAIHHHAARGNGLEASRLASRRLRGSGLQPAIREIPLSGPIVQRTAAALIFPLPFFEIKRLRQLVERPTDEAPATTIQHNPETTSV